MRKSVVNIFFSFCLIINFDTSLQCGSGSAPAPPPKVVIVKEEINDTKLIEESTHLKFLVNFERHSKIHLFDEGMWNYIGCKGKFHKQKGRVMHGLCSYCVEMHATKNNVYWRCMDKCFTSLKTDTCLRTYEELCKEKIHHFGRFIEDLSGRKPQH